MPNLSKSELYRNDLRSYLQKALPDSSLKETEVASTQAPLLLLNTEHLLAAFAFSGGDVKDSYETIYGGFKKYYREYQHEWRTFDIAFVFCVDSQIVNLTYLFSDIETDVYFCRKYIVPYTDPIGASLAHLPFLPLAPLNGHSLRPPSARLFIQNCGVPAELAKNLVVQGDRSPQKIAEDCAVGKFGSPTTLVPTTNTQVFQLEQTTGRTLLDTLTIENFRAYKHKQTIAFGADITILYGPNGFGKTSLFDAVEFVTTGEIGRLKSHGDENLEKIAAHLDSEPSESSVSLSFLRDGTSSTLIRAVNDRKSAKIDSNIRNRKQVLSALTGNHSLAEDRVENFISLFRATHYFNQERPELTKDFHEDCCLPADIVARMLAFEDYNAAASKSVKVQDVIRRAVEDSEKDIEKLLKEINNEKAELERLNKVSSNNPSKDTLEPELKQLIRAIEEVGISVGSEKPDASLLRNWRASLEARLSENLLTRERLTTLSNELSTITKIRSDLPALEDKLNQDKVALSKLNGEKTTTTTELRAIEASINEATGIISGTQKQLDVIEWARHVRPEYVKLCHDASKNTSSIDSGKNSLNQAKQDEQKFSTQLSALHAMSEQNRTNSNLVRDKIARAHSLTNSMPSWKKCHTQLAALLVQEDVLLESLAALRVELIEHHRQAEALASEKNIIGNEVKEVENNQSDLKKLVAQLLQHIDGAACPLCGVDHTSQSDLLLSIEAHANIDISIMARTRLRDIEEKINQHNKTIYTCSQAKQIVESQLKNSLEERRLINLELTNIELLATDLGVILDTKNELFSKQLDSLKDDLRKEAEVLEQNFAEINQQLATTREALNSSAKISATKTTELAQLNFELQQIQNQTVLLRDDPRAVQIPFELEDGNILKLELSIRTELSAAQSIAKSAQSKAGEIQSELSLIEESSTTLQKDISKLESTKISLLGQLSHFGARLQELRLPEDTSAHILSKRISDEQRKYEQIISVKDKTINLEMALDAANTAAALTQLRVKITAKEAYITEAYKTITLNRSWLDYFNDIFRFLSSQQNEAVTAFTKEYGPRTSIIQRRLRSVYGFEDVEILSDDSAIKVRVHRNGEVLRPTNFFSQSQQQTLFMGLFLTACISQTWSAFSPIFLDDPVTHFDDLNIYAFLDLLLGLIEAHQWKKQFVISTCNEKFLQLALQKFRHLVTARSFIDLMPSAKTDR